MLPEEARDPAYDFQGKLQVFLRTETFSLNIEAESQRSGDP